MILDIDECKAAEAHNCSVNAFCNNTESAYNCTCEPGYLGDGWNCTGNCLLYEETFSGLRKLVSCSTQVLLRGLEQS